MHRLPGQAGAQRPPLPSTTPMPPVTLCSSLLPAAEDLGRDRRAVILQAIQLATTTGAVRISSSVAKPSSCRQS